MIYVVILLMLIGLLGIFIPGIPGNGLIFLSILGYGFYTHFEKISITMIIIFGILTGLAFLLDYISSMMGAKKFGATKAGIIGGILGGILGIFILSLPGMILGQFLGTLIGEMYYGQELKNSIFSGVGTVIGFILGVILNITIGVSMISLFLWKVFR
ncbi:DUF456 domain-containing protein [Inediibacterium massiliense]|uniref:DUF456 domain-containing protein n=1 Tax=Inediibacterium massiliense TaxID=1658111 RepID=UPI0006B5DA85|nr:DUF456 domain-containing protein [Inediibacterium massiliense]